MGAQGADRPDPVPLQTQQRPGEVIAGALQFVGQRGVRLPLPGRAATHASTIGVG